MNELRAAILGIPAVAEIVGTGTAARVWNGWPRTLTTPCIVMELDRAEEQNYLDTGKGEGQIGDVVLTCRADSDDDVNVLREALRKGIAGFHGNFDLTIESIASSRSDKGDNSTDHWYDRVFDCTALWTEAI